MNSIPRLYHSILLLLFVLAPAACGRSDAPLADDVPPTADAAVADGYPAPPTVNPIYPAPENGDPNAFPAPTVRPTPTPLPLVEMPPAPAEDFAFTLVFGSCNPDIVDTFQHTYTQKNLDELWATTLLTLTETEMMAIYQKMIEVNFFAYPEQYRPQNADGSYGGSIPSSRYQFTVQNDGKTTIVEWMDVTPGMPPPNKEAQRLQELGEFIIAIAQAYPEVKQLPERQVFCW